MVSLLSGPRSRLQFCSSEEDRGLGDHSPLLPSRSRGSQPRRSPEVGVEELGAEQGPGSSVGTCARPRAGAQDGPWGPGGDAGSRLVSVSLLAGLCVGQADGGRAEVLPKPSLRAWPSSVVPARSSVTLRCGAPTRDVSFTLRKGGRVWEMVQSPDSTEGRAEFHLPGVTVQHAGEYSCEYHGTGDPRGSSGPSDALLLLVTGEGAPGKDGRAPGPGDEGGSGPRDAERVSPPGLLGGEMERGRDRGDALA
ncbi:killer cell immunoglobulin-like receptor 3DL1 [Cervus elaphus]|uniref:killer cell immunoglobulin-like receptor 3DL1 n=1 Tax=Cervus elaphus TaxID=9860 RepID=UPI001CC306C8|nr:killer cell immunoglobulin-like receptor 3DL1 [Cervus elaphus]